MSNKVRVRMAPSPTGYLHIGSLRTALYNYLFAKKEGGIFILRIEDTDRARLVPDATEQIVKTLTEFNMAPDEGYVWQDGKLVEKGDFGPYIQSQRLDIYHKHVQMLIENKTAYYCFCTPERLEELRQSQQAQKLPPKYDKHCLKLSPEEIQQKLGSGEKHVIRLNVPADRIMKFDDLVFGHIEISTNEVDDQVLIKSDGYPTYHFAVVVDDHHMQITHVFRGDEYISSTPKDLLLYEAFGWELPRFVHLPPIISKVTKKKLSKREGDVSVQSFVDKGYLREAIINFLAFLGWNPKTEQEKFTLDELIQAFSLDKLNKAGATFDLEKLDWFNSLYIREMPLEDLYTQIEPFLKQANLPLENFPKEFILGILKLERERLKKLSEIGERVQYFFTDPQYEGDLLVWKKSNREATQRNLQTIYSYVQELPQDKFNKEFLETEIKKFISENNLNTGEVLWPLRVALSGLPASPSPFEIMGAFGTLPNGKEIILRRINTAIEKL